MQYMQLILGYSPLQTAWALGPVAIPIVALGATMHLILPKVGLRLVVAVGLLLIAAGLFSMRYLHADSAYIEMVFPFLITSTGIGLCVAPTTSAIMNAVPTEKQGVASAVNDTTREVGAAVGIAVAGSVLAAQYTHALGPGLAALPEQVRGPALASLANALEVAKQIGPQGAGLAHLAENAFLDAMDLSLIVVSTVLAVAAAFVAVWAPGRDGRQFRFIRRLTARGSDDELGGTVAEHDNRRVGAAAGDGRQDRPVDHP
jgi:hypothetical protein